MNIYFDTEFTGLHKNTTLISIGLVADDGRTFYAEFNDYDKRQVNKWIKENVIDNLIMLVPKQGEQEFYIKSKLKKDIPLSKMFSIQMRGNKKEIKKELSEWLLQFENVQLISDVSHYDMVLFIDIFGTAFDLPSNVSATCYDINQDISKYLGVSNKEAFDINRETFADGYIDTMNNGVNLNVITKHNSLWDAYIIKACFGKIKINSVKK